MRRFIAGLLAVALTLGFAVTARSDVIILKDGFTLHGEVSKEKEGLRDPLTGEMIAVSKLNGFSIISDGPRSVIFSPHSQRIGDVDPTDVRKGFVELFREDIGSLNRHLPNQVRFTKMSPWTRDWKRVLHAKVPGGSVDVKQFIRQLTPYYARIYSNSHNWKVYMLTQELGRDTVRGLLRSHPTLVDNWWTGGVNVEGRMQMFHFYTQANWFDLAEEELQRLEKDKPDEQERIEAARVKLRTLATEKLVEQIDIAMRAGQFRIAETMMGNIPKAELNGPFDLAITAQRADFDSGKARFEEATGQLAALRKIAEVGEDDGFLLEAAGEIADALRMDNSERLDTFATLAKQAEKDRAMGRKPTETPVQLLALAVNGWYLGGNQAVPDVELAKKVWAARAFLRDYLAAAGQGARTKIVKAYEERKDKLGPDEIVEVIRRLPPSEPLEVSERTEPYELTTPSVKGHVRGVDYLLQLPPEYHHGRPYPVLIAMHRSGGNGANAPKDMIARYGSWAAKHGYILAVPKWSGMFNRAAGQALSDEDRITVTATLRDVKRRTQVDSDRVFLTGFGEGATLAFEVGIGQPDLFAGVVPICPDPDWTGMMMEYWPNAQFLPFYVVTGNLTGESSQNIRRIFQQWMPKGFPSLAVVYHGRGFEWYPAEMPTIFDWMDRQKRADPLQVGKRNPGFRGLEFRTGRESDDHFYWVEVESINEGHLLINTKGPNPAYLHATLPGGNRVVLSGHGIRRVTVWLSPAQVDFALGKVYFTVNSNGLAVSDKTGLEANLGDMLEDFIERGDRQRLFFKKFTIPMSR